MVDRDGRPVDRALAQAWAGADPDDRRRLVDAELSARRAALAAAARDDAARALVELLSDLAEGSSLPNRVDAVVGAASKVRDAYRAEGRPDDPAGPLAEILSAAGDSAARPETAGDFSDLADRVLAAAAPPPPEPLVTAPLDCGGEPPARRWLVDGLIPHGRLTSLYGRGAVGKSRLTLQLALAVASPDPVPLVPAAPDRAREAWTAALPRVREHGRVVFLTWEDEVHELVRRVHMLERAGAFPPRLGLAELKDLVSVCDMRAMGGGPLWGPAETGGSRHVATAGEWTPAGRRFLALLEAPEPPAIVVVDPIAAAYGNSEIERALVRRFLAALDGAAESAGCTVLLVGHPPKGADGRRGGPVDASGSTDWRNAPRGLLVLDRRDTGFVAPVPGSRPAPVAAPLLLSDKSSYGPVRDPLWLVGAYQPRKPHRVDTPSLAWFAAADAEAAAVAVEPGARPADPSESRRQSRRRAGDDPGFDSVDPDSVF